MSGFSEADGARGLCEVGDSCGLDEPHGSDVSCGLRGPSSLAGPRGLRSLRDALRLYAVTDDSWLEGRTLAECVSQALAGGATFVQLREKGASADDLAALAKELLPLCRAARVPLVVNDDVDAVALSGADGVHVGQGDTSCAEARRRLGPRAIVGVSVQTVGQALAAQAAGASYLGVGAVFDTSTKPDAQMVPLEELRAVCRAVSIPVVAIGGIDASVLPQLANSGVAGVAVVSALFAASDIEAAARELARSLAGVSLGQERCAMVAFDQGLERGGKGRIDFSKAAFSGRKFVRKGTGT